MLDDIGPWDFKFGEAPEELLRVEPDGKIIVGDIVLDGWVEVVRRVKATECLSALYAKYTCQRLLGVEDDNMIIQCLSDYARALEGNDA